MVVLLVSSAVYLAFYRSPPGPPVSSAFAEEPAFDQVWAEQQGFSRHVRFDPEAVFRFADFRSEYVNQVDGIRTTWRPPECECRRWKVWWFGGSAGWGFFQADDDTIPSQLAKAAWEQGVALDIENRALPGYTLGQESQKFAALTATERAPDLVIFYDGANELDFQIGRNGAGRGDDESPISYYDRSLQRVYALFEDVVRLAPSRAEGSAVDDEDLVELLDAPELAGHAINRYRRGVDVATRVAASVDAQPLFVWQPTQTTASALADAPFEGSGSWPEADREWFERLVAAARAGLPPETVDLSDVFENSEEPIMPDWPHTNTRGAQIVADSLTPVVLAQLTAPSG